MSTIAKGEITLSPVNDAYTVSLTPSSCVIKADFDGSNPQLSSAKGIITVKRGVKEVVFYLKETKLSSDKIRISFPSTPRGTSIAFFLTAIDNTTLNGWVDITLVVDDGMGYETTVRFNYTVVRESTMLDWIQDWEGSKTKVGGTYIMTPKLFVGKKEEVVTTVNGVPTWVPGALTGVYIGPDLLQSGANAAGIYGYLQDKEIFHINADGGFIGGWTFNEAGLQSSNGIVNILAEGTIFAQNPQSTTPYWGIYADGHATFANGNVKFQADGSAEFAGKIISTSGHIGGWKITKNQLYSNRIILDSNVGYIGVNASELQAIHISTGDAIFPANPDGGLKIWYTSANDFGMAGWASGGKVFQLGSSNFIASWNFNHQAIWAGATAPSLTQGAYAADTNSITIAPNGIRSNKWYVDANGTASFVGGSVKFNTGNAEMFGWLMRSGRFSAKHVALVSSECDCGVYVSPYDLSEVNSSSLKNIISNNGGIYLYSDGANSIMRAYDNKGNLGFMLSTNGYNQIGEWAFNHESIYTGNPKLNNEGFTNDINSIILSVKGIIGPLWKLLPDGSGAIAGGNISWNDKGTVCFDKSVSLSWQNISGAMGNRFTHIDANGLYTGTIKNTQGTWILNDDGSGNLASGNISWDTSGNVTLGKSVKMAWSNITNGPNLTQIDANGVYTGEISANKITAGTISTASIKWKDKWCLSTDGSGYLASGNISWASDGSGSLAGGSISWEANGILRMTGWVQPTILEITDSNIHQYMTFDKSYSYFDISKTGRLIYYKATLLSQEPYSNTIWLPSVPGYLILDSNEEFNKTRTLLGTTFSIYNFSTEEIKFVSWDYTLDQVLKTWTVKPGHFVVLTCGMGTYTPAETKEPMELIGWHGVTGKIWNNTEQS